MWRSRREVESKEGRVRVKREERGEAMGKKMERFKMSVLVKFEGGVENVRR